MVDLPAWRGLPSPALARQTDCCTARSCRGAEGKGGRLEASRGVARRTSALRESSAEEEAHPSSMYLSWYWSGWPSAARFLPIGVDSLPQQYLSSAAVTSVSQASCQQHSQQPTNHARTDNRQPSAESAAKQTTLKTSASTSLCDS